MCDKHKLVGVLFGKEPDVLSVVWAKQQKVLTSSDCFKKGSQKGYHASLALQFLLCDLQCE